MYNNDDKELYDYWQEIMEQPRAYKVVDFPRLDKDGNKIKVAIVPLTQAEVIETSITVERFVRRFFKEKDTDLPKTGDISQGYDTIYDNKAIIETLFRACKKHNDITKPFFNTVEAMESKLTLDELAYMMRLYSHVRSDLSPTRYTLSPEEIDAWIERAKYPDAGYMLEELSPAVLGDLIVDVISKLNVYQEKEKKEKELSSQKNSSLKISTSVKK